MADNYSFDISEQVITPHRIQEPILYRVLLHNDDYTPFDFVYGILRKIFHKNQSEATKIVFNVHEKGVGVCGIYSLEVAETKVNQVHALAEENEYPLQASYEEV